MTSPQNPPDLSVASVNDPIVSPGGSVIDYFVHASAIVDAGAKIGKGTKIWHFCHVSPGAVLGENCSLGQNVFVANRVTVGNGVKIQNNVSLYEGVVLEDYVFCGPSMVFTNVRTPRSAFPRNTAADYADTLVKYGASIGANGKASRMRASTSGGSLIVLCSAAAPTRPSSRASRATRDRRCRRRTSRVRAPLGCRAR